MLLGQLTIDLPTLRTLCLEDPSLGQGVFIDDEERAWIIGIIDPLTGFNLQKKLEYSYKRTRYGNQMSCVPPKQYGVRFITFMNQILKFDSCASNRLSMVSESELEIKDT